MRKILGLVMGVILVIGYGMQDAGYQIPDEIVIVRAPSKEPRNPYQDEYERMLYPTVRITAGFSTGSGVIFHRKDAKEEVYILTACHVVENETTVSVELYDSTVITASVVITDTAKDLALLCASAVKPYYARLAPKNYTPYIFTPVYTVGCSLGLTPRPSQGIISVIGKYNWEVTSPVLPGNSGGPVYDARTYEVIGIAVWVKVCQGQLVTTMAGIVPINQIYEFLDSHEDTKALRNSSCLGALVAKICAH